MSKLRGMKWDVLTMALALCAIALRVSAKSSNSQEDNLKATPVDKDEYNLFMTDRVSDLYDLEQWFVDQQYNWLPIAPPSPDFILRQPSGQVLPYDWTKFPDEFNRSLEMHYENTVPAYTVKIGEDPATRETVFFNEKSEPVYYLAPVAGYDPQAYVRYWFPELFTGRYLPWYVEQMIRLYDPARIQAEVTLIPVEYAEPYLYVQQRIAEEADVWAKKSSGGGIILMSYYGPPVTNICFAAMEKATNFIRLTVAYPFTGSTYPTNCFTNRLDFFYSSDLIEFWWDLAATTNVSPATNWIEWTDRSVTNTWATPRLYATGNADLDTDGDGFTDARELLIYHTDPNDSTSRPVTVSGTLSYSGIETGACYALATAISNGWSLGCSTALSGPGVYSNQEVAVLKSYWFKAFVDANANLAWDVWEPWGLYSSSSTYVTGNVSGVNISLQDAPSIWGSLDYAGSQTGDIWVIAVTASNSWDTTYSSVIPWAQGEESTTGATMYVTFPVNYTIAGLPASNYWIRAFIDSDENDAFTDLEAAGQYAANATPVSNRVTGIDIILDLDTDSDGMPDWWEMQYGLNPTSGLSSALAGWWKFDEGSGTNTANSAAPTNHGFMANMAAASWTTGKLGQALSFDGADDYVRIPQNPAMITGGPFTVSAWAWYDGTAADGYPTVIGDMTNSASGYPGYWLGCEKYSGGAAGLVGTSSGYVYPSSSETITGRWAHLAMTYDGTTARLYLDGIQKDATNGPFAAAKLAELKIGWADDSLDTYHWKGKLDDIRLYTTALSSNAVCVLYDAFQDLDGDDLANVDEYDQGTLPDISDTDGDGMKDGDEVNQGYDPLVFNEDASVSIRFPEDGRRLP